MTEQPAGWYPDPFAAEPGASRFWDGERWTTQVQSPLPEPQQAPYATGMHGQGRHPGTGGHAEPSWGAADDGRHPEQPWRVAGESRAGELASWGRRLGAYLLDAVPMVLLGFVLLAVTGVTAGMQEALASGDAAAIDAANAMLAPLSPTGITVTLVTLLASALYNIGFHVSRGATPGKMLVGIRVRQLDDDRNPDLRAAGLRWLVQFGPGMLSGVGAIGFLAGLFNLVDHFFPLWDRRNQAIHDKAGRTVVVCTR